MDRFTLIQFLKVVWLFKWRWYFLMGLVLSLSTAIFVVVAGWWCLWIHIGSKTYIKICIICALKKKSGFACCIKKHFRANKCQIQCKVYTHTQWALFALQTLTTVNRKPKYYRTESKSNRNSIVPHSNGCNNWLVGCFSVNGEWNFVAELLWYLLVLPSHLDTLCTVEATSFS